MSVSLWELRVKKLCDLPDQYFFLVLEEHWQLLPGVKCLRIA